MPIKLLPFSFGFEMHGIFIQGGFSINTDNGNQVNVSGILPDNVEFNDLNDLAQKTKWTQEQMQSFVTKIKTILNKQQKGQLK